MQDSRNIEYENRISFFFYGWKDIIFIRSSINVHLGCFHILVFMNIAAVNIEVQITLQDPECNYFEYNLEVGLMDHQVV